MNMSGIRDLDRLLASLEPRLRVGEFVFVTMPGGSYGEGAELSPVAAFEEEEGLTLVIPLHRAEGAGLTFDGIFRMISLGVHSSLSAVGLTAAVADVLAGKGISANMIAAFYHDHVFVPAGRAEEALGALKSLAS